MRKRQEQEELIKKQEEERLAAELKAQQEAQEKRKLEVEIIEKRYLLYVLFWFIRKSYYVE